MRHNQVRALARHRIVKLIAVIRLVADDAIRRDAGEHEVEQGLHQLAFMRRCGAGVNRHRQAACIDQHHDFHAFSGLCAANTIAAALGFTERAIDEAFKQFVAAAFFHAASGFTHQTLEHARLHPGLEPSMHRALAAEALRQIFPLRTVVEDLEDARNGLAFVRRRPSAFWIPRRIRHALTNPVQLLVRESHRHANLYCATRNRFRDRFYTACLVCAGRSAVKPKPKIRPVPWEVMQF